MTEPTADQPSNVYPNLQPRRTTTAATIFLLALLSPLACHHAGEDVPEPASLATTPNGPPLAELYSSADRLTLLAAAQQIIGADPVATLISVDDSGRPRVRTVDAGGPDDDWSFWVATRPGTRKVEQLEEHPDVTLHFETDDAGAYVSLMGRARIHRDDVDLFDQKNPISAELMPTLFPDYPDDYLLIEIQPSWLELLSTEIEASSDTWRPQAVVFDPVDSSS